MKPFAPLRKKKRKKLPFEYPLRYVGDISIDRVDWYLIDERYDIWFTMGSIYDTKYPYRVSTMTTDLTFGIKRISSKWPLFIIIILLFLMFHVSKEWWSLAVNRARHLLNLHHNNPSTNLLESTFELTHLDPKSDLSLFHHFTHTTLTHLSLSLS